MTAVRGTPGDTPWERLHPLSPVARGGRAVIGLLVVVGSRQASSNGRHDQIGQLIGDGALAVAGIAAGVVAWLVTRWRVHDGELQIETGLVRRQSTRVNLTRVQAIDVVRPLIARVLGMSELRMVLAGQGAGRTRLAYLGEEHAVKVRAQLLALAHGLDQDTPDPGERPLLAVSNGRLAAGLALGGTTVFLTVFLAVVVVLALVAPRALAPSIGSLVLVLFGIVTGLWRRFNAEASFQLTESPDGLRIRAGLLQTTAETIPFARVQAVRLVEPFLWRPLGWCRLEIDVAQQKQRDRQQQETRQLARALLPIGSRADADRVLAVVFPGLSLLPPAGSEPPRKARLKAPLSYRYLAAWHDAEFVVSRTGRLRADTVALPLHKMQSIRTVQGPVQRRLHLATVAVDSAGRRWVTHAKDRPEEQARTWLDEISAAARAARAERGMNMSGQASAGHP